jgi:ribosomal protein L37E
LAVGTALPNRCALCGNLSHNVIADACDAAYWNEARLRCEVWRYRWASVAQARRPGSRHGGADATSAYRCDGCRATPPPFDATLALADYRAPLDGLRAG